MKITTDIQLEINSESKTVFFFPPLSTDLVRLIKTAIIGVQSLFLCLGISMLSYNHSQFRERRKCLLKILTG